MKMIMSDVLESVIDEVKVERLNDGEMSDREFWVSVIDEMCRLIKCEFDNDDYNERYMGFWDGGCDDGWSCFGDNIEMMKGVCVLLDEKLYWIREMSNGK